jgi:hypothetical protein
VNSIRYEIRNQTLIFLKLRRVLEGVSVAQGGIECHHDDILFVVNTIPLAGAEWSGGEEF